MSSICIVTPDIIGPTRNGGIGTACWHLARYLSGELGHRVCILFTGPTTVGTIAAWKEHYRDTYGIDLYTLADLPPGPDVSCHNGQWFVTRSWQVHEWLAARDFDQVHFQDWQANGFIPVQAKRCGLAYARTLITCTLHSSTEWINEGARQFVTKPYEESLLKYAETYVAQHADLTISPSQHMVDWCQSHGWRLRDPQVIPNLFEDTSTPAHPATTAVEELCFFGRLETRKGLELYAAALEKLITAKPARRLPRLSFLGKEGRVAYGKARPFLRRFARRHGLAVDVIDSFNATEAIAYLRESPGRVAVLPSLLDNLPYTVVECLQHGIRFIASDIGGVPELVHGRSHLFEPTTAALARKLEEIIDRGLGPVPGRYDPAAARERWRAIAARPAPQVAVRSVRPEDVTICIAHYNYGRFLPGLLSSLDRQSVQGFSVIVVDDGSTDQASVEAFRTLRTRYVDRPGWRFLEKPNGGIGETRNLAASLATTDYLVFMDADNEAESDMVELMVRAMAANPVDCLTCFMRGFADEPADAPKRIIYYYTPSGPCLEAGLFANCFGDANFIVRKAVFAALGGFGVRRDASFEDWEFLARLSLRGFTQDVIPECLFLYRHTPGGFSRTTSPYLNHGRILDVYAEALPPWAGRLLGDVYASVVPKAVSREEAVVLNGPTGFLPRRRVGVLRQLERTIRYRRKDLMARWRRWRAMSATAGTTLPRRSLCSTSTS